MQVTREQGLSHIDFEIATLVPFAGKTVVSISKAALARLAARKAAAEAGTKLTSVVARTAAASETPVVWESWARLPKVEMGGKIYAKIGDRLYTRHAIDRTLPESLGWSVGTERPGVGVSPSFVEDIIKYGRKSDAGGGRIRYKSGHLEVITEQADKIIVTIKRVRE